MKKRFLLILAVALLVVGSTAVLAAGQNGRGAGNGTGTCPWTETCETGSCVQNGGVCSYCGNPGHCYTDADGDGVCDHRQSGAGSCQTYGHHGTSAACTGSGHHRYAGSGAGHHGHH